MVSNKITFYASTKAPNPDEVDYWIDLTQDPDGSIIKYYGSQLNVVDWHEIMDLEIIKQNIKDEIQRLDDNIEFVRNRLAEEIERAKEEEKRLDTKITAETQRAILTENWIQRNVETEAERAKIAEDNISARIDKIVAGGEGAYEGLLQKLDELRMDLENQLEIVDLGLNGEIDRAKAAEAKLSEEITSNKTASDLMDQKLFEAINNEVSRALAREEVLQNYIQAEAELARQNEQYISNKLDKEIIRSVNKDVDLQEAIVEETARATSAEIKLENNKVPWISETNHQIQLETNDAILGKNSDKSAVNLIKSDGLDQVQVGDKKEHLLLNSSDVPTVEMPGATRHVAFKEDVDSSDEQIHTVLDRIVDVNQKDYVIPQASTVTIGQLGLNPQDGKQTNTSTTIPAATQEKAGVLTSEDKKRLDGINADNIHDIKMYSNATTVEVGVTKDTVYGVEESEVKIAVPSASSTSAGVITNVQHNKLTGLNPDNIHELDFNDSDAAKVILGITKDVETGTEPRTTLQMPQATPTAAGSMSSYDKVKVNRIQGVNYSISQPTQDSTKRTITLSGSNPNTGDATTSSVTLTAATQAVAGLESAADKVLLDSTPSRMLSEPNSIVVDEESVNIKFNSYTKTSGKYVAQTDDKTITLPTASTEQAGIVTAQDMQIIDDIFNRKAFVKINADAGVVDAYKAQDEFNLRGGTDIHTYTEGGLVVDGVRVEHADIPHTIVEAESTPSVISSIEVSETGHVTKIDKTDLINKSKKLDHNVTITLTDADNKNGVKGTATTDLSGAAINIATEISNIDASKITSGTIDIARLPKGALERLVIVADQAARFALTTADVQVGDTVKQNDTGTMYYVVDDTKLNTEAGYSPYTAAAASSVPWAGVTGKPTTLAGYGITDAYTKNETATQISNYAPSKTGAGASGTWGISVTGNAGSANRLLLAGNYANWTTVDNITGNGLRSVGDNTTTNRPFNYGSVFQFSNVANPIPGTDQHWITQLLSSVNGALYYRHRANNSAWSNYISIVDSKNFSSILDGAYVNTSGDTMTGSLSVPYINITDSRPVSHIAFNRENYNYISSPADSFISFVTGGKEVGATNAVLTIATTAIHPGTTNEILMVHLISDGRLFIPSLVISVELLIVQVI